MSTQRDSEVRKSYRNRKHVADMLVAYASGKKFLGSLEPILLAPPNKALVSPATHRMIADILADITYNFGQEKGFEGLGELWRKIKMPQEPDSVSIQRFTILRCDRSDDLVGNTITCGLSGLYP